MSGEVSVRGNATAEELAVVLAVMSAARSRRDRPDRYTEWRTARLAALARIDERYRTFVAHYAGA